MIFFNSRRQSVRKLRMRRYRREARYSKQLRVTVQPATAAALEADAAGVSVSAVIRDAVGARVAAGKRRPAETAGCSAYLIVRVGRRQFVEGAPLIRV